MFSSFSIRSFLWVETLWAASMLDRLPSVNRTFRNKFLWFFWSLVVANALLILLGDREQFIRYNGEPSLLSLYGEKADDSLPSSLSSKILTADSGEVVTKDAYFALVSVTDERHQTDVELLSALRSALLLGVPWVVISAEKQGEVNSLLQSTDFLTRLFEEAYVMTLTGEEHRIAAEFQYILGSHQSSWSTWVQQRRIIQLFDVDYSVKEWSPVNASSTLRVMLQRYFEDPFRCGNVAPSSDRPVYTQGSRSVISLSSEALIVEKPRWILLNQLPYIIPGVVVISAPLVHFRMDVVADTLYALILQSELEMQCKASLDDQSLHRYNPRILVKVAPRTPLIPSVAQHLVYNFILQSAGSVEEHLGQLVRQQQSSKGDGPRHANLTNVQDHMSDVRESIVVNYSASSSSSFFLARLYKSVVHHFHVVCHSTPAFPVHVSKLASVSHYLYAVFQMIAVQSSHESSVSLFFVDVYLKTVGNLLNGLHYVYSNQEDGWATLRNFVKRFFFK